MRVLVTTESRFDRTPDGACWNVGSASYEFWRRYLDAFDEVCVVARLRDVTHTPRGVVRVDGPHVSVAPLPYYIGPWGYLRRYRALRRTARAVIRTDDAVIVRAPGVAAALIVAQLGKMGRPFGIEVVGDPLDVFAPGGVRSALRPFLRRVLPRTLRRQCASACAAAYVTADSLQRRYPAGPATFVTTYSSIDLSENAFVREPRPVRVLNGSRRLVFVGSLEQLYKGPDVLIDTADAIVRSGVDLQLTLIGDGKHRPELEARVGEALAGRVRFLGHLPAGDSIRRQLDDADVFVLPSRTEGLPRALIEAMARGLPCVASDVGGIPELLSPSERVPPGDVEALAAKLLELLRDPERLARLSRDNLRKARDYHVDALRPRRQAFYRAVREAALQ
jgi:glycosyltransferase involved in cell wall biosynthesis